MAFEEDNAVDKELDKLTNEHFGENTHFKPHEIKHLVDCLKYSLHRLKSCSHAGIKKSRIRESDINKLIKKLI